MTSKFIRKNDLRDTIERQTMPKVTFGGCKESQVETSVDLKDQKRKERRQAGRICSIVMFVSEYRLPNKIVTETKNAERQCEKRKPASETTRGSVSSAMTTPR